MNRSEHQAWRDRAVTWSAGIAVAGGTGHLGAPPVLAASFGVAGALVAAATLTYGARVASWYRDHAAAVGVGALCLLYLVFGLALVWIRWGA